ncbi:MAG: helix-turn-helix domain-containing protein [Wenzhouxiangella sp.]
MTENPHDTGGESPAPDQLRLPVGRAEEEIGIQLRQQRLKRRLRVETAARELKLSVATVERIERGELDALAPIYRRGYVQNYARYLGLDPEPLLGLLASAEPAVLRPVLPIRKRAQRFDRVLKFSTYLIVTTLIVPPLVLIYIQGGSRFIEREPEINAPMPTSLPSVSEQRIADRVARALALDEKTQTGRAGAAGESTPVAATAMPIGPIRPLRDPGDLEPSVPESTPGAEPPGAVLAIEVLDDSWLEIYGGDGERLEYDLLRGGDRRQYRAEPPFRLLLGRASAIALKLDGQPVEFEGHDRADVASFELLADGQVRRQ